MMTKRLFTLAVAALAGLTLTTVAAVPARADEVSSCKSGQNRTIALPGKTDVVVWSDVCTRRDLTHIKPYGDITWEYAGPPLGAVVRKFHHFEQEIRLERRSCSSCNDTVVQRYTRDLTAFMNQEYEPTWNAYVGNWATMAAGYYYSADVTIRYDIQDDGAGEISWNLTGSPLI
jgi:hypothetical protein